MTDKLHFGNASTFLYRFLNKGIASLDENNLRTIRSGFSTYAVAIHRFLDSPSPTQKEFNDLRELQAAWCSDIEETRELAKKGKISLIPQSQREDELTLFHVVKNQNHAPRTIPDPFLKDWRTNFVQDMQKKQEQLEGRLKGLNISDEQMIKNTDYLSRMFSWMDHYLEQEMEVASVTRLDPVRNQKTQTRDRQREDR